MQGYDWSSLAPGLRAIIEGQSGRARIMSEEIPLAELEILAPSPDSALGPAEMRVVHAVHALRQMELLPAMSVEIIWRVRLPVRLCHRVRPRSA